MADALQMFEVSKIYRTLIFTWHPQITHHRLQP